MIKFESSFKEALLELNKVLIDRHFDLLVRELKLHLFYFREPGFVYYGNSIDRSLARLDKRYSILIELLCLNRSLPLEYVYENLLSKDLIDQLLKLGLFVEEEGRLRTDHYAIIPLFGTFIIATLGTARSIGAYLGRQSYIFAQNLFTHNFNSFLDLGCGCGVLAILAARRAKRSIGVDIMEEAVDVAKTNSALNNLDEKVEFYLGDMYEPVKGMSFDSIAANAPFVALPSKYSSLVAISSGEDGLGFLHRLIDGMFSYKPNIARMLANGLGSDSNPLIMNLLRGFNLSTRGYKAKLLVYSKGVINDDFAMGAVKLVEGAFAGRGDKIERSVILSDLKTLYRRLGVDYYYGIVLEIERGTGKEPIEIIDISNRYGLQSSPALRESVKIENEEEWSLKLGTTSMNLNSSQKAIFDSIKNGEKCDVNSIGNFELYSQIEKLFGAEPLSE